MVPFLPQMQLKPIDVFLSPKENNAIKQINNNTGINKCDRPKIYKKYNTHIFKSSSTEGNHLYFYSLSLSAYTIFNIPLFYIQLLCYAQRLLCWQGCDVTDYM